MRKYFQFAAWLVVTMLGACSGGTESKEAADTAMEDKPVVRLASVTSRDVDQIEEYTATVEAEAKNNIAPTSPGRIDRIFVEVGDHVSKGQKLVQMDAANLKQMKLQLENEETEFRRMDELYKVGGASKSEWDAAKTALDVRRTSYNNLLENTQLLSPIYNPQIQISAESETKRSIFREKDKTKRSKKESAQHSKSRNKSFVMTSVSAL